MNTLTANQYLFLRWLSAKHPRLYDAAGPTALKGVLDVAGSLFQNVLEVAPKLYGQYVTGKQELKVLKENLARARSGLGPVNPDGTPFVLPPGSQYPSGVQSAGLQPWMIWAAIAVGAFLLLRK